MKQFVIRDINRPQNSEYPYLSVKTGNDDECMSKLEDCKKYSSRQEAQNDLMLNNSYWTMRFNGDYTNHYVIEEIETEEETETLSEKTYYVIQSDSLNDYLCRRNGLQFTIYLDNAWTFGNIEAASEKLSQLIGYHIRKIVETTTSQKIDHERELKKVKKAKLEKSKNDLEKRLSDLNHESVSIMNDIERINEELQN